jgi:hypothetical protein
MRTSGALAEAFPLRVDLPGVPRIRMTAASLWPAPSAPRIVKAPNRVGNFARAMILGPWRELFVRVRRNDLELLRFIEFGFRFIWKFLV